MSSFEKQTINVLRQISESLSEIQEGLTWPTNEHVGYRLADLRHELAELEERDS